MSRPPPLPGARDIAGEAGVAYDRVASLFHWGIGLALMGQIAFGFLLDEIAPRSTPSRAFVINLHKSFGITLFALIVLRLFWRLRHAPPPWPADMSAAQQRAATVGHRVLYACMLLIPLAGYTASNFSKYGVKFYGIDLPPWGPESQVIYTVFNRLHVYLAWVFTALIVGHLLIALKHSLVDHDGGLRRIWPWRWPHT